MHPWQRQPGETPPDFTAFAAYLRLKGRRSLRAVAAKTGRSLASVRRLSAQFNWPGRVVAFEARLADATQDALDSVLRRSPAHSKLNFEQFREAEYHLANQVIHESNRWLKLAANPRRPAPSLAQICRLTELSFKLGRLAAGLPTGDQSPRRRRREDAPGYWTGHSVEEALEKTYGSKSPASPASPDFGSPGSPLQPGGRPQGPSKPAWPPPDDKRDLTPHRLVIGPHGLWCLQRLEEGESP